MNIGISRKPSVYQLQAKAEENTRIAIELDEAAKKEIEDDLPF